MKPAIKKTNHKKLNGSSLLNGSDPEKSIRRLAKQGAIATAGKKAIAASFRKGLSVTVLEDGIIYRLYPDGKRTILKKQIPARKKYTTGKMIIR
jgi:hypothetical protein